MTNQLADVPTNKEKQYVCCEYLDSPLTFNGFKFDLRIYVAITCVNPLRLYMYEEGLTRFATCKYQQAQQGYSKGAKFMHLTNFSVNKKNLNFVQNEGHEDRQSSKWSLTTLKKAMVEQGIDPLPIWRKIEDIVVKTILAAEQKLFTGYQDQVPFRNNCFELLGFDILIDSQLEPWLIEVNLSPSLGCDSPLDLRIKGALVSDLFTLVGVVPLERRKQIESSIKPSLYSHKAKDEKAKPS